MKNVRKTIEQAKQKRVHDRFRKMYRKLVLRKVVIEGEKLKEKKVKLEVQKKFKKLVKGMLF